MEKLYFIGTNGYDAIVYTNDIEKISRIYFHDLDASLSREEKEKEALEMLKTVEDTSSWDCYGFDESVMFERDEFENEHFEDVIYAEITVENLL